MKPRAQAILSSFGAALILALLASAVFGGFAGPLVARAAGTIDVPATCNLADAITAINTAGVTPGACTGLTGAEDTISLSGDVSLSDTPTGPDTPRTDSIVVAMTINGNGHTISRGSSATDGFSLLEVGGGGILTLNNVTLTGGVSQVGGVTLNSGGQVDGGGILNHDTLTVNSSTITGNIADGGSGGGIFSDGTSVAVNDSTISSNTANAGFNGGGGVALTAGSLTMDRSTVSGNTSAVDGGGIFAGPGTTVSLNNVTVSGNHAGTGGWGGGIASEGSGVSVVTLGLSYSTITLNDADPTGSGQGGGLYLGNTNATMKFSIVSGNTAFTGDEIFKDVGGGIVEDYNLLGQNSIAEAENDAAAFSGFTITGAHDRNATGDGLSVPLASILNTALAQNAVNPHPFTHALVTLSPAIDWIPQGTPALPTPGRAPNASACVGGVTQDQRTGVRADGTHSGANCDIGAFEFAATTPTNIRLVAEKAVSGSAPAVRYTAIAALLIALSGLALALRRRKHAGL